MKRGGGGTEKRGIERGWVDVELAPDCEFLSAISCFLAQVVGGKLLSMNNGPLHISSVHSVIFQGLDFS